MDSGSSRAPKIPPVDPNFADAISCLSSAVPVSPLVSTLPPPPPYSPSSSSSSSSSDDFLNREITLTMPLAEYSRLMQFYHQMLRMDYARQEIQDKMSDGKTKDAARPKKAPPPKKPPPSPLLSPPYPLPIQSPDFSFFFHHQLHVFAFYAKFGVSHEMSIQCSENFFLPGASSVLQFVEPIFHEALLLDPTVHPSDTYDSPTGYLRIKSPDMCLHLWSFARDRGTPDDWLRRLHWHYVVPALGRAFHSHDGENEFQRRTHEHYLMFTDLHSGAQLGYLNLVFGGCGSLRFVQTVADKRAEHARGVMAKQFEGDGAWDAASAAAAVVPVEGQKDQGGNNKRETYRQWKDAVDADEQEVEERLKGRWSLEIPYDTVEEKREWKNKFLSLFEEDDPCS